MAKGKSLNLDQLYGTDEPVLVVFKGETYELSRPESWTPATYSKYVNLQRAISQEEIESAVSSPKGFNKLIEVVDKIMNIISPEMAKLDLPFEMKSKIIEHYTSEVFPEELSKAKIRAQAKNLTGA